MKQYSFNDRMTKLFAHDNIRLMKLLEMIQYTIIYFLLVTFVSYLLNKFYFSHLPSEEKEEEKSIYHFIKLISVTILESISLVIILFYIRKIALIVPSIASSYNKQFIPHTTMEYIIHVSLVFVLLELVPRFEERFHSIYEYIKK